jgi:hypothetical protein
MEIKSNLAKTGTCIGDVSGAYQGTVSMRAVERAGHCKNLNGHVFEILYKDKYNCNPPNIINGRKAHLTKSPTAVRDDIVAMQGGKVVERVQCKDTPSPAGANDTIQKILSGKYSRTKLVGTSETTKTVNGALEKSGANTSIRMKDSKISSKTTNLIACQANGANPLKHLDLVGHYAGNMAKVGGTVGGGISLIKNVRDVHKGEKDVDEAAVSFVADTGSAAIVTAITESVDVSATMAIATIPGLRFAAKPIGLFVGTAAGFAADMAVNTANRKYDRMLTRKAEKIILKRDDAYTYLYKKYKK